MKDANSASRHTMLLNPSVFPNREDAYYDEVGGFHSPPDSWNPYGVWHGECTRTTCKGCKYINDKGNKDE